MTHKSFLLVVGFVLAVVPLAGCEEKTEFYCCTTVEACSRNGGGGVTVPCTDPDRPFCDNEGVYPASNGVGRTCIPSPGGGCSDDDPCEDPALSVCLDGTCVACGESADCPVEAPACEESTHACAACTDSSECARFADRPHCEDAACVGCRTAEDCAEADAPICDDDSKSCRPCGANAECASEICERDSGACVAEGDVLYVTTGGGGATCTQEAPCGSIQTAIDGAGGARNWIHVASGTYNEALQVASKTVRIVADGADLRSIAAVDQPGLEVTAGADVAVDGLVIRDASGVGGDGILCNATGGPSTVRLRGVRLENNDDQGLDADACAVEITQSTLSGNPGGGLSLENASFVVTNNFIVRNGQPGGLRGGVSVESTMAGIFAHNTVVDNVVAGGQVGGVECDGTHSLHSNIVFGNSGAQTGGAGCSHAYSLIGPESEAGRGNIDEAPSFVSLADGDFHLAAGSAGIDVAMESDVTVDHDGDLRPAGRGPDMGADETTGTKLSDQADAAVQQRGPWRPISTLRGADRTGNAKRRAARARR